METRTPDLYRVKGQLIPTPLNFHNVSDRRSANSAEKTNFLQVKLQVKESEVARHLEPVFYFLRLRAIRPAYRFPSCALAQL